MTDAPPTIALDPSFIAEVMGVEGATFDGFIGTGQMSRNARFTLDAPRGGPTSVVVKLPSADPGTRAISFEHAVYRKECGFYESVAGIVDVDVPHCHLAHFDDEASDFALVLEDLAESVQGDQFRDATTAELYLGIEQIAALQAPVWDDTGRPELQWLHEDVDEHARMAQEMAPFFNAVTLERLGDGLDADVVDLLDAFAERRAAFVRARMRHQTLVHGDFRPDNFLLAASPAAPPIVIVDWQTVSIGLGVTDVGYFVAGALPPERRRAEEADLLRHYRSCLAGRGVSYDVTDCERDYAITALHGLGVATTATALAERTDRGDALFTQMVNRHGRHALDLGALDVLASLES